MLHWQIRKIEFKDHKPVAGHLVAEVTSADGSGQLTIHDSQYEELLTELFAAEQFALTEGDYSDGIYSDGGQLFPPWHPESLQYVRGQLPLDGLMVVDIP